MFSSISIKKNIMGLAACFAVAIPTVAYAEVFQAENYSAFFDTTPGNTGGVFRSDSVDIEPSSDNGNGFNVGWIEATEWLTYKNLVIPSSGDYVINVRVASATGGQLSVDLNAGAIKFGNFTVKNTGGWQKWDTTSKTVHMDAGTYTLGVYAVTGGWNFNWIEVVPVAKSSSSSSSSSVSSKSSSSSSSAISLPVVVQAEDFSSYNDLTTGNTGGKYRPNDNVDIEAAQDDGNGFNVGWTQVGEWLEYKVALPAGNFDLTARVASAVATGKFSVLIDGASVGSATVGNTTGWQAWKTQTVGTVNFSSAATHTVRVQVEGADFNLNWLKFDVAANVPSCTPSPLCADKSRGEWTLVVIPDTQHYSQNPPNAPLVNMQRGFDWIVESKDNLNIKFVQGLGDITENFNAPTDWEWQNSFSAWNKLSGKVAYIPVKGNHDLNVMINKYFPVSMFSRESWWGGNMGTGIENNYGYMTIGREEYLFLQVTNYDQHRPDSLDGLNWAKGILAANPNKKVILATHDIWATTVIKDNLLTKFDNIVMANAGHDCVRQTSYVTTGPRGGVSNNFVSDFQCDPKEVMFMRYYVFKPLEDKVYYYTYSPVLNQFLTTNVSQGSFTLIQKD